MPPAGLAQILEGRRIVICAGAGGVGKTTTSAALAMGMAARGLKVAVVTIDPARRLATSLGLDALGNDPALVDPARFARHGIEMRGELWAMMLDAKRTFDALIEHLAPDARSAQEVLSNRIYESLSSAVAGSQEFTAVAKLYELDAEGRFDLLVLDTPPSRNALDFLDAPDRLTGFFQGRAIRMFLRPAGLGGRVIGRGTGVVFSLLKRVTGVDLLDDLSVFFRSLGGMVDGFTERAARVKALLEDPATTWVLVSSPEPEPAEETRHFGEKLAEAGHSFGALVINRMRAPVAGEPPEGLDPALAAKVRRTVREQTALAERDATTVAGLREALGDPPTVTVPLLPDDVHDVDGLALVLRSLV